MGYRPGAFEYCGQGEPLLNPKFRQMVALSRKHLPGTRQRVITSGNVSYAKTVGGEHVEEFYVSADGVRQESYEKYRINGRVDRALAFMRDAKAADPRSTVIWKYILFEFNDSDAEIQEAQKRADDLGVDTLLFVCTHSMHKSTRYTAENLHTLPIVSPVARMNVTPVQKQLERPGTSLSQRLEAKVSFFRRSRAAGKCVVDEFVLQGKQRITVRGWATDAAGNHLRSISAFIDGEPIGLAMLGQPRGDVLAVYPHFSTDRLGFFLQADLPIAASWPGHGGERGEGKTQLMLKLESGSGRVDLFHADYSFA